MKNTMEMIKQHYEESGRPNTTKFNNYALPPKILEEIGSIGQKGVSPEETVESLKKVFKYSVNTMHPMYLDKFYSGTDPEGQIAELVVAVLNTNNHVYVTAPVFTVMETECVKVLAEQFGFPIETTEGIANPGGSMSNMTAMIVARNEQFPHVRL